MNEEGSVTEHTMLCHSGITSCDERREREARPPVRFGWGHMIALTIVVTIVWVVGIMATVKAAEPEPFNQTTCYTAIEHTEARAACRAHGWHVNNWFSISPHKVVRESALPACTFEDGSGGPLPCSWNFMGQRTGNNLGLSYWIGANRVDHYVWGRFPQPIRYGTAHWATRWERHHLALTTACWVRLTRSHQYQYQCPTDPSGT